MENSIEEDKEKITVIVSEIMELINRRKPLNIDGWTVQKSKQDGYYRAFKRTKGKNTGVYIGKHLDVRKAKDKIKQKLITMQQKRKEQKMEERTTEKSQRYASILESQIADFLHAGFIITYEKNPNIWMEKKGNNLCVCKIQLLENNTSISMVLFSHADDEIFEKWVSDSIDCDFFVVTGKSFC